MSLRVSSEVINWSSNNFDSERNSKEFFILLSTRKHWISVGFGNIGGFDIYIGNHDEFQHLNCLASCKRRMNSYRVFLIIKYNKLLKAEF